MAQADCDIAVIGGGVVGAAAALALSRSGFDLRLLERAATPPPAPAADYDLRVYAISPGSMRLLDALGAWQPIEPARRCAYEAMSVWESQGRRTLSFDAAEVGRESLGWIVEQSQLLHALWSSFPAGLARTGAEVVDARFDESGAVLTLADASSLRARLVLAAEGARSPLREQAGIDTIERSYRQCAVVAHVATTEPHRHAALQCFLPGGPLAFLPLADGRRSMVWSLPTEQAEQIKAMPAQAFHQRLGAAIGFRTGAILASTPRLLFPLRLLHAREYVRPSLALLGDSAHVVHPLAGQGLNLGLGDAQCLAQVLTQARDRGHDWGGERTLRRYERARQAASLEMLALTDALDRLFRSGGRGLGRLLDLGLGAVDRAGPVKRLLIERALG